MIAVFSYRYEAHLVPDLIANIGPAVQGWIAWDDRGAETRLTDEPARRAVLITAARDAGADWILAVDPDERVEAAFASRIGFMTARGTPPTLWTFHICEMFTPKAYRIDGVWGEKRQVRLFPAADAAASPAKLHGRWEGGSTLFKQDSRLRLYHLRMASPRRRQHRRETYATADPERRYTAIGYDYLAESDGKVLEKIEPERAFRPLFVDDDGLWAPPRAATAALSSDPPSNRLRYVQSSRQKRGGEAAKKAVAGLLAHAAGDDPDHDLLALQAQLALEVGDTMEVERITGSILDADGGSAERGLFFRLLRGRARLLAGDKAGAEKDLHEVVRVFPESRYPALLVRRTLPFDIAGMDAPWRRWADAEAELFEGTRVTRSDLAVVIIGCGAPPSLRAAVESVLGQDVEAEVVVVNSGGGPLREVLQPYLDRIRLISCKERRFVGAARNIGVDASQAPFVAFLASDCRAMPGWVAGRLARHRAGAVAVGNPVAPERRDSLVSLAANLMLHHRRQPDTPPDDAGRYGLSYARMLFHDVGYFSQGLRVGEDLAFNALVAKRHAIDWAPEVVTTHRYPTTLHHLAADHFVRGLRRTCHRRRYAELAGRPQAAKRAVCFGRQTRRAAVAALRQKAPQNGVRRAAVTALIGAAAFFDTLGVLLGLWRLSTASRYAEIARELGERDSVRAEQALRKAISLCDQDWRLHLELAQIVGRGPTPDRAAEHWRRAAALEPYSPQPIAELCNQQAALGRLDTALAIAEHAIAAAPAAPGLWRCASNVALRTGNAAKALFYARGYLVLSPAGADAHRQILKAYRKLRCSAGVIKRTQWIDLLTGPDLR